jgi:hypothetical protein
MSTEKISFLPDDTIVDIQLSGAFYKRLQTLLFSLTEGIEAEDVQKIYKHAVDGKAETVLEYNVETMLLLCKEVEEKTTEQKLWSEEEIELGDNT